MDEPTDVYPFVFPKPPPPSRKEKETGKTPDSEACREAGMWEGGKYHAFFNTYGLINEWML